MSLKDNFNQAVKEILKKDGLVGGDEPTPKEQKKKTELEKYLEPSPRPAENLTSTPLADALLSEMESETASPYVASPQNAQSFGRPVIPDAVSTSYTAPAAYTEPVYNAANNDIPAFSQPSYEQPTQSMPSSQDTQQGYSSSAYNASAGMGQGQSGFGAAPSMSGMGAPMGTPIGMGKTPPPPKAPSYTSMKNDTPYFETEETTVISRNTVIDGNIRSFANITIDGSVKGDVKITKNINVSGKVVGDIECNNSTMMGASMQGNILSKGQVQVDRDSLLLGDISAQYLDLNGKIKGNIDVGGKAEFKTDAIILGNITASTITVLDGATIQGYVNTTFLQESSSSIFPEAIAVTE